MPPFYVSIAGVDRTAMTRAAGSVRIEAQLGARTRVDFEIRDYDSFETAFRPALDQRVIVTTNTPTGPRLFNGQIFNVDDLPLGDPGVGTVTAIKGIDDWRGAGQRRVAEVYTIPYVLKAIVSDLTLKYLAVYGIALDVLMPDGPLIDIITFDAVTVEEAFARLSTLSGWVYRLRPDNVLEWFVIGSNVRPFTLSAANRNILGPVRWSRSREQFVNRVFVRYGTGLVGKIDAWVGNGSQVRFPISYPLAVAGWVTYIGGPYPPGGGHEGVGADAAVGYPWWYDAATNELVRNIGAPIPGPATAAPPAAGDQISLEYTVQYPLTVAAQTPDATTNPWETVVEAAEIFSTVEAQNYAESLVRKFGPTPRTVTLDTRAAVDFLPGDTVRLDIPSRTLPNSLWMVTAVAMRAEADQEFTSSLTLIEGTEAQASWVDFWREALGSGSSGNQGIASGSVMPSPAPGGGPGTGTEGGSGGSGGGSDLTGSGAANQVAVWTAAKNLGTGGLILAGGKLTGGATGAGFTIDLVTSTVIGTLPVANLPAIPKSKLPATVAYTDAANTFTVSPQNIHGVIVNNGKLTGGATGAGFTIDLVTSTVVGTLPVANLPAIPKTKLPATVAYTDAANVFTVGPQTIKSGAASETLILHGRTADNASVLSFYNNAGTVLTGQIYTAATGLVLATTGDVTFNPAGKFVLPLTTYTVSLGTINRKYLAIHAAELWVETLVAQNTMATIGGRILVGNTTSLTRDVSAADTTIYVKHNSLLYAPNGAYLLLEASGKFEAMRVTSTVTPSPQPDGSYAYTVTRNLDGTGANVWYAGDAVFDSGGIENQGFLDIYSARGVITNTGYGPTIVGNVRTSGAGWNAIEPRWAIGNLDNVYGYVGAIYGACFGDPNKTWVSIDATYGFYISYGQEPRLHADTAGNLTLSGNLAVTGVASIAAGSVRMHANGIDIVIGATIGVTNSYSFITSPPVSGGIVGMCGWESGNHRQILIQNVNEAGRIASVVVEARTSARNTYLRAVIGTDTATQIELVADQVVATGPYRERGRVVPMGEWQAAPYIAGDFYAPAPMIWTVQQSDIQTNRYSVVGKTMTWVVYLNATSLSGGPGAQLHLRIPGGYTSSVGKGSAATSQLYDGAFNQGMVFVGGVNFITLQKDPVGNFTLNFDTTYVIFTIILEVD